MSYRVERGGSPARRSWDGTFLTPEKKLPTRKSSACAYLFSLIINITSSDYNVNTKNDIKGDFLYSFMGYLPVATVHLQLH